MQRFRLAILITLLYLSGSNISNAQDGYSMINGTTTGGAGGNTVTVTTAANLITYATSASPYIIRVSGTITLSNRLDVAANKTIEGVNTDSKLSGNKTTVNVGGFTPGVYIIKLYNGQEIITRKFLKK